MHQPPDAIRHLQENIMSHKLTQPEEIDHILVLMSGSEEDTSVAAQLGGNVVDTQRNLSTSATGFANGIAQKKLAQDLLDP